MSICRDCENLFLADILVDGKEFSAISCIKHSELFRKVGDLEDRGYKCTVKFVEDGEIRIPDILKCNFFMKKEDVKLYQHEETGRIVGSSGKLSHRWREIPTIYEDELPEDIKQETYDWWWGNSIIKDGVRIGPDIKGEKE